MINFANFRDAILAILGLSTFSQVDGHDSITEAERARLMEYGFSDRFISDFEAYLKTPAEGKAEPANKQAATIAAVLGQTTEQLQARTAELDAIKAQSAKDNAAHQAAMASKEAEIAALNEKVAVLSALPEEDPGKGAGTTGNSQASGFNVFDDKQLGGMQGEYFSLDRPYNQRARAALLAREGMTIAMPAQARADFQMLQDDLGAFYRTPWRDRLQSFLVELPSITELFPTESGHQDLDTLVNLFLGEFSQADNTQGSTFDNVAKGEYSFGTETLRMYDVMFVHRFKDLKALEKSWIGYLNREGSNALKLSFIEFLLVETAKQLHNERELRWVNGVRKDPEPNNPGRAMEAADGLYEYLRKKVEGHIDFTPNGGTMGKTVYQIKPFELPHITPANIGEVFYLGTGMIPSQYRDTGRVVLYIPSFMLPWYHKYNEAHYGRNLDYKANIDYVKEFPSVRIMTIPNADNHHRIFWTFEGNIQTFDHVAGEMLNFSLEQEDWSMKAWSEWKESIAAVAVGYKYTNRADMDGSRQLIWCNDYDRPDTYFLESDKDANPSALLHNSIVTVANSSVFAITDIKDTKEGEVVAIKCGADGDNGVTIAKSGKFSLISAAWTPAKGDVIRLMKRADGKFIEISRSNAASESYQFEANATTPSVEGATVFVVGANTQATAITDLEDAVVGTVYTIYGAGSTNASTIANSGNFVLTAAMTLSEGKFIRLVKAEDGKFYEVARG